MSGHGRFGPNAAPIYVVGHVNPDTDAVASAVGYAWLLARETHQRVAAARAGTLRPQTTWALQRLGLDAPVLLVDAAPRFGSVARRLESVEPDRPLGDAWSMLQGSPAVVAPVVDQAGRPFGLVTGPSLLAFLAKRVGTAPVDRVTTLGELFDAPCSEAVDREVPVFRVETRIRDTVSRVLREERDDFWVVDDLGRYVGVCRKPDLLSPPRLQLVLVDHNAARQALGNLDEAVVLEVLDHHRLDAPPTRLPIRFHVDPVGSTSTLVAERLERAGLTPPAAVAGLLWAGLLSDTLMLRSPTATERDRMAADRLAGWATAPGSPLDGETQESFGRALLARGAQLSERDPAEVVTDDLKSYEEAAVRFGIGQVEVLDFNDLAGRLEALTAALARLREQRGLDFVMLMVTDIVGGSSRLVTSGSHPALAMLAYPRLPDGTLEARGVVSRKKQVLPAVLGCLNG